MAIVDETIFKLLREQLSPFIFKEKIFNKIPKFIKGTQKYADEILSIQQFESLIRVDNLNLGVIFKDEDLVFQRKYLKSPELRKLTSNEAINLRSHGAYLVHDSIQEYNEPSSMIGVALKEFFNIPGQLQVTAWSAVKGGGGVELHTDRTGLFTIQLHGKKKWKISDKPLPQRESVVRVNEKQSWEFGGRYGANLLNFSIKDRDCYEVVMEPGDILYLPPFSWHATAPMTDNILSLNFRYSQISILDVLNSAENKSIRQNLPRLMPSTNNSMSSEIVEFQKIEKYKNELSKKIETYKLDDFKSQIFSMICNFKGFESSNNTDDQDKMVSRKISRSKNIVMKLLPSTNKKNKVTLFFGEKSKDLPIESMELIQRVIDGDQFEIDTLKDLEKKVIRELLIDQAVFVV